MKMEVLEMLEKVYSWNTLGADQVQVFWIKQLTILHKRISKQLQGQINHPEAILNWHTTAEVRKYK